MSEPKSLREVITTVLSEWKIERHPVFRTSQDEERGEIPRALVLRRDGYRCVICGSTDRLEADHILPWSALGADDLSNLRTLCHTCNDARSNYAIPADTSRRLPHGFECVHCCPSLITDYEYPEVEPIYCVMCNKKAPGVAS